MQSTVYGWDGSQLVFEQDITPVRTMGHSEPDPDWTFTDSHGHPHYYRDGYPTLKAHWHIGYCGTCNDDHEPGEILDYYTCKACDEEIKPGIRWVGEQTLNVVGYRSYSLRNAPVSEEEGRRLMAEGAPVRAEGRDGQWRYWLEYKELTKEEFDELAEKWRMEKRSGRMD